MGCAKSKEAEAKEKVEYYYVQKPPTAAVAEAGDTEVTSPETTPAGTGNEPKKVKKRIYYRTAAAPQVVYVQPSYYPAYGGYGYGNGGYYGGGYGYGGYGGYKH